MLYTQTVAPRTLELLKKLEAEPQLASFSLAGGTALVHPAVVRCEKTRNLFS